MYDVLAAARTAAEAADAKKALNIVLLDIRAATSIADYFVICSGSSTTQVSAIVDGIGKALARSGIHPLHIEGQQESTWILIDYGSVVVHVFEKQTRIYYGLDRLWGDVPRIAVQHTALQGVPA